MIPSSDAVVHGYRIAITPDRLLGRSESARSLLSLAISPLGPLTAGLMLEVSARATIGLFAAVAVVLALWGTASNAIRETSCTLTSASPDPRTRRREHG